MTSKDFPRLTLHDPDEEKRRKQERKEHNKQLRIFTWLDVMDVLCDLLFTVLWH